MKGASLAAVVLSARRCRTDSPPHGSITDPPVPSSRTPALQWSIRRMDRPADSVE